MNVVDLSRRLAGKSVREDALMPWSYQSANPKGRPLHDDWPCWPATRVRRMDTWYRLPLPFKCLEANYEPRWMAWQEGYPEAPEAQFRAAAAGSMIWSSHFGCPVPVQREVLAYDPVPPTDENQKRFGRFAVWLDGAWRESYSASTRVVHIPLIGKRRIHTNGILKYDMTHGDFGCQYPDASCSLNKIS